MSNQLQRRTGRGRQLPLLLATVALAIAATTFTTSASQSASTPQSGTPSSPDQSSSASAAKAARLPRGKKLMLKDGTFQLVREYHVEGDRVRYYSIEQSQWDEVPESLVDWNATNSVEREEAKRDAEVVAKVHARESGRTAQALVQCCS